jgi:RNA recognition motif-containing protein
MTNIQKLAKLLGVEEITDNYISHADLSISEYMTADNYDVHVITNESNALNWETDVYYYQPPFEDIIDRIKELDEWAVVWVSNLETYFPEDEVEEYLEEYNEKLNVENYAN